MIEPGNYDELCVEAREKAQATAVILLVIAGQHGSGFSAQAPLDVLLKLPTLLRMMADDIEASGK